MKNAKLNFDNIRSKAKSSAISCDIINAKLEHANNFFNISDTKQRANRIKSKIS